MLFLSSRTVDATPKSTATSQQQQEKTVYHISVILRETPGDAAVSKHGKHPVTHTLVEKCQQREEIISIVPMENSPKLGRLRYAPDRWPSLSWTGRAGRQQEEVVVEESEEELEGKMKTSRFLKQPFRNLSNSSQKGRDLVEVAGLTETQERRSPSATLHSVTLRAKGLVFKEHGTVSGHRSLPRAVLRRPCREEATAGSRPVSMYGDPTRQQRGSQPEQERPLLGPRGVCMLAGPGSAPVPVQLETHTRQPFRRADISGNSQARTRKSELRAVDGLSSFLPQQPLVLAEVTPRVRQRSWKPRPVSMTVLELRKRGSDDEMDSQKSCGHTSNDGGSFLTRSFRWKLFGKTHHAKSKEKEGDKDVKSLHNSSKADASKSTFSTLRRSLSLRIRKTRPRDKVTLASERDEGYVTNHTAEEANVPPRPFSYLTGRAIPTSSEQLEEQGMQYIQYHSKGKVKVMEVPLCPTKLASKPVQEEVSLWQLIANRFRRKEQPNSGKCEPPQSQNKDTSQYPLTGNNKSEPVTIQTLAGTESQKGQGKTNKIAEIISQPSSPLVPSVNRKLQPKRNKEVHFFFFFLVVKWRTHGE